MSLSEFYARRASEKCDELQKQVRRVEDTQRSNQQQLLFAFNRMAEAIDGLAREVRAMREELSPQRIDKPKLPTPEAGG